jgi:hypothetical protein
MFKRSDGITERVYFAQPDGLYTPHAWQVAVDTLSEANRLATESGAEFVVVYIPRKYRVYHSHLSVSPDDDIAQWKDSDLPEKLGKWCMEYGINFVDLTPFLETLVAKGLHPYFVDDVHWNKLGHKTAVQAIIHYLSAEHVFPFNSGPRELTPVRSPKTKSSRALFDQNASYPAAAK